MHIAPDGMRADAVVLGHALSVCAAVLGGRLRGPAGDSMQRVVGTLSAGRPPVRLTAGRVVFDLRQDGLYPCREHRGLPLQPVLPGRSEERRVGKEGVSTGSSRGWPYHLKTKQTE